MESNDARATALSAFMLFFFVSSASDYLCAITLMTIRERDTVCMCHPANATNIERDSPRGKVTFTLAPDHDKGQL